MLNFYTRHFSTQRTPERQMNILEKNHDRKAFKALKWAFPYTIPIFAGFWFLGIAYGIYANASGFSFVYPLIMSMAIYGGSLEFITVSMLLSPFAPVQTLIMAVMIQARHLFYGIFADPFALPCYLILRNINNNIFRLTVILCLLTFLTVPLLKKATISCIIII